jgi:hypothetical protein
MYIREAKSLTPLIGLRAPTMVITIAATFGDLSQSSKFPRLVGEVLINADLGKGDIWVF